MIGAIAGDVIGSVHEGKHPGTKYVPLFVKRSRFTDDTVLTVAVAHAIRCGVPYADAIRALGAELLEDFLGYDCSVPLEALPARGGCDVTC